MLAATPRMPDDDLRRCCCPRRGSAPRWSRPVRDEAPMSWRISLADSAERCASERTSLATTAKPRPGSPARAASTAALSARMLVWKARPSITPMISFMRCALLWMRLDRLHGLRHGLGTAIGHIAHLCRPGCWPAARSAALSCTVLESSCTLAAVCSRLAACCSVRSDSSRLPVGQALAGVGHQGRVAADAGHHGRQAADHGFHGQADARRLHRCRESAIWSRRSPCSGLLHQLHDLAQIGHEADLKGQHQVQQDQQARRYPSPHR